MKQLRSERTHLFMVRIWRTSNDENFEIRGSAQHVLTGDVENFATWEALRAFLEEQSATEEEVTDN